MTFALIPVFYALVAVAALWLLLLCCVGVKFSRRKRLLALGLGAITVWLLLVPLHGLPLWSRAYSFYPNPSLPLLGILCAALWHRLLGVAVFKPADCRAVWMFGAVAGTSLYLHPFIFKGALDLYFWGWDREVAAIGLGTFAVVLLALGSRLGVLMLAALLGYAVNALESQNCWDYVMDPIYWLISLGVLAKWGVVALFRLARNAGRAADGEAGSPKPA
jgi:hypothetical protein